MSTDTTSNTTSNNVWTCKFCKKQYQRNMIINHHVKTNCIDHEFKQQLKHDLINKVNVKTKNNIKQSYDFMIS